jgi:hypothetical protein
VTNLLAAKRPVLFFSQYAISNVVGRHLSSLQLSESFITAARQWPKKVYHSRGRLTQQATTDIAEGPTRVAKARSK